MLVYSLTNNLPLSYFRYFRNDYVKMNYTRKCLIRNMETKDSVWVKNKETGFDLIGNWNELGFGKWQYTIEEFGN